jgi:hypothetical protein
MKLAGIYIQPEMSHLGVLGLDKRFLAGKSPKFLSGGWKSRVCTSI